MFRPLALGLLLCTAAPASAAACEWGPCDPAFKTTILELRRDAAPARDLQRMRFEGFELADGQFQSFSHWYAGRFMPMRADMLTQVTRQLGLLWGLSSGEYGEKYTLQPGFRAGFVALASLTPSTSLSFTARTTMGGRLKEKPCTANYGAIGGVQSVNCRLAATELAPEDTLAQLWNFAPADQTQLTLRLTASF